VPKSVLDAPHYKNEAAAYEWLEARLWPNGPECPRCQETKRVGKLKGKSTRLGVYKCYKCRKPFRVTVDTIFEASNIPLHIWLQGFFLMNSSKKGVSANQLSRTFGLQLRSAWFMGHRIREAMRSGSLRPMTGVVEVDETFIGRKKGVPVRRGVGHKHAVLALVQRGGEARTVHVSDIKTKTVVPIVDANIAREAQIMTDTALQYENQLGHFASHDTVNHAAEEYARYEAGRPVIHTNVVESYFALFKRGMRGVYQHCSERHLHRYLAEFDFRHNNRIALGVDDEQRTENALRGVKGRRLTYRKAGRQGMN
jgi:transposase-like protein